MLGNIWLSSALIVIAIFSTSSIYTSYSNTQEAKQIQENYQIVSNIITLLSEQYNKSPDEVTRDEIMMHLPVGGNWEKVLLLDRNNSSNISNNALVNKDGNFVLRESEILKLFALRARLRKESISFVEEVDEETRNITFLVNKEEKLVNKKNAAILKNVNKAIEYLNRSILFTVLSSDEIALVLNTAIDKYTPYSDIYQNMKKNSDLLPLTDIEIKQRKEAYFRKKIKEKLILNKNPMETKLYYYLKDLL
jgi:hypothetical protein